MKFLYLLKVLINNNISLNELSTKMNLSTEKLIDKLEGKIDFVLFEIEIILKKLPNYNYKELFESAF